MSGGADSTEQTWRIAPDWLHDDAAQALCRALGAQGAQVFFVGGCVRNALLGAGASDLDISTDARPEQVMELAGAAGFRAIPTGIDHGTVTVVVEGTGFEVTTFRRDVETDGRRAVVTFSDRIEDDAQRRDFTMNALYADAEGRVHDPLGGMADLSARRVRFIGDAVQRIREDYLRILRYFRFNAWYGDPAQGFDAEALAAIAETQEGIAHLSRERVGAEMMKLLGAPDPAPAVAVMRQTGVLQRVLPGADDRALALLIDLEADRPIDATSRLAAILGADSDMRTLQQQLRLSSAMATRATDLRLFAQDFALGPAELAYRQGGDFATRAVLLRAALLEQPLAPSVWDQIKLGSHATMPLTAQDLMPEFQGAVLGKILKYIESEWISSGFSLSASEMKALARRGA